MLGQRGRAGAAGRPWGLLWDHHAPYLGLPPSPAATPGPEAWERRPPGPGAGCLRGGGGGGGGRREGGKPSPHLEGVLWSLKRGSGTSPKAWAREGACRRAENELAREQEEQEEEAPCERVCAVREGVQS